MLAIRMQRVGRKGHPMYRVIVQEAHRQPTSGRVVAALGSYDPHSKAVKLDSEKAAFYLNHGARPSDRVIRVLEAEKVSLPDWVSKSAHKQRAIKNPAKLRSNQPPEESVPEKSAEAEPAAAEVVHEDVPEKLDSEETPVEPEATPTEAEPAPASPPAEEPEADSQKPGEKEQPAPQAAENTEQTAQSDPELSAEAKK